MPVIVFVIFIILAVVGSIIKAFSSGSKSTNAAQADKEAKEDNTSWDSVFAKISPESDDALKATKESVSQYRKTPSQRPAQMRAQRGIERKETYSQGHHQIHCDVNAHNDKDKYRVEKVPVMNSIGGKFDEGCREHYDVRFVKVDEKPEKKRELTELQKVIVYGEVLNNPAFKRKGSYYKYR